MVPRHRRGAFYSGAEDYVGTVGGVAGVYGQGYLGVVRNGGS